METDAAVEIKAGNATGTGTGMKANNATRQVELGGRGTMTLPPRAAK
jgi:lipopolysaccharide export system protein LptC